MNALSYSYSAVDPSRRYRGIAVTIGIHVFVGWALVSGTAQKTIQILKKPLAAVVIQEVIIPPAPPAPQPKKIRAPEPVRPNMATPMPTPQVEQPLPSLSRTMEAAPQPQPQPQPAKPAVETPVTTVNTPAPADTAKAQAASMEAEYVGKVRTMLNLNKRYPTGRQASQQRPQGKVKVWFTLTRNGELLDVGVLESSNSNLLDDAALSSVRRGTYPPFPEHTWPGQERHKFSADIEFAPPGAD